MIPMVKYTIKSDYLVALGLALLCLSLFIPGITALGKWGLYGAFIFVLGQQRWKVALPYFRHPVFLSCAGLIFWFALTAVWSEDPITTGESVFNVFKEYPVVVIPLLWVLSQPEQARFFSRLLVACAVIIMVINGVQYIHELATNPSSILGIRSILKHREWAHPLVYLAPFVLLEASLQSRWPGRIFYWGWYLLLFSMVLASTARAAWLALVCITVLWAFHEFSWKKVLAFFLSAFLFATVVSMLLPPHLVRDRIQQGMDTSLRITGTWGPAIEMLNERPMSGFGFGKKIFDQQFNLRAPDRPDWSIKQSIGPHSIYLETGFSAGYPGLLLLLLVFLLAGYYGSKAIHGFPPDSFDRRMALAALSAFAGFYITRGAFESVRWAPMILLLTMIVFFSSYKNQRLQGPRRNPALGPSAGLN